MISELLLGVPQAVIGFKQMKELSKVAMPEYGVSKELQASYNRAESMTNQGFTPAEKAAMLQSQAGSMASQTRAGLARTGGSMSSALQVISGLGQNQFNLGLGSQDAQLRRQNIRYADTLMRDIDRVRMMNQELKIKRDQAKRDSARELAYTGLSNVASGISDLEGVAMQVGGLALTGGIDLGGNSWGKTKTDTDSPYASQSSYT